MIPFVVKYKVIEVNSDTLSRCRRVLVKESRSASNLPAYLRLAACVALNRGRAFDAHPFRAVDEVLDCLGARVAKSLVPDVG